MKKSLSVTTAAIFAALLFTSGTEGFTDLWMGRADASASQFGNMLSCRATLYHNQSTTITQSLTVGFYLSTDTVISPLDTYVGKYVVNGMMGTNSVVCKVENVDMSTLGLATGTYYIGSYADINNDIPENGMTPEFANNGAAVNVNSKYTVIQYPAVDVGIKEGSFPSDIRRSTLSDGSTIWHSENGEELCISVFTLDGKLVRKETGHTVALPQLDGRVYLVHIKTQMKEYRVKVVM